MNEILLSFHALPLFVSLPTLFAYTIFIALMIARTPGLSARFLLFAIAARLMLSAMPHYSFAASPVGLSWNALGSVLVVAIGIWTLARSAALRLIVPPVALIILVMLFSGVINGQLVGSFETIVKYIYFSVVALATFDACMEMGLAPVLRRLLASFSVAYVLQLESLLLGVAKQGENDGSASYIGGFYHEASFSIILMTGMLVAVLNQRMRVRSQLLVIAISVAGILLANYRTAILAMAPLLVGVLVVAAGNSVVARQRMIVSAAVVIAILAAIPAVLLVSENRFDTLAELAHRPQALLQTPDEFTQEDRRLLAGRAYFWSEYITAWRFGDGVHKLVGFGANSWEESFGVYAHNTLVSTLYELGVFGVAAMLTLWMWMLALAWNGPPYYRFVLTLSHFGFIILNMATMPFWLIEGLIFYGILCGVTVYLYVTNRRTAQNPSKVAFPFMATPSRDY
ncbi:MAG: O-antigen ligase family protein [bacterium]|nr:O-antigen ligase family protein [bacterium]